MKVTQAQLGALFQVYERWQNSTPHAIMPTEFEIVTEDEYTKGDYIGVWVGGEPGEGMYLGVEADGYTHS